MALGELSSQSAISPYEEEDPVVALIPVMKDSDIEECLVHGVPDPPSRDV